MTRSLGRRDWLVAAAGSGIAGALTVSCFAAFVEWRSGGSFADTLNFLASVVAGDQILGTAWALPLGIVVLFAASIGWAVGYLHAARRQRQLLTRPVISGIGFGIVVWVIGFAMVVLAGKFRPASLNQLDVELIGLTLFFGVPLATVAARLTGTR